MLDSGLLKTTFDAALPYDEYVATGKPDKQEAWTEIYNQIELTEAQRKLLGAFQRDLKILVSSGTWCGDCVQQCPLLQRIAEATDRIELRFVDRDEHAELSKKIQINAGMRVPVAIFMAEDFELVSMLGDRTLTRYRAIAEKQLGSSCPLPGAPVPTEELAATLQDWLGEVERVHLLLRLSTRLRQKHED